MNEVQPHNFTHEGQEVLILRRIPRDRKAHNGFLYPAGVGATVTARDWNDKCECGGGLHGWPWSFGLGEGQGFDMAADIWLILGADQKDVIGNIDKGWKCKCRTATIRYEGDFKGAMDVLRAGFGACIRAMATPPKGSVEKGKNSSAGDYSTIEMTGKNSVAAIAARNGKAKAIEGSAFALAFYDQKAGWDFVVGKVGVNGVKSGVWYEVVAGKLSEVK